MPAIRSAQLVDILEGTTKAPAKTLKVIGDDKKTEAVVPNPEYETWLVKDQQLLGYLLNSLTKEVLAPVATLSSAAEVWATLEGMYAAQSRARATNLRMQLVSLKKGSMTAAAYFSKMKSFGDELAAIGKKIEDDEMVSYILNGLDFDYNSLVSCSFSRKKKAEVSNLQLTLPLVVEEDSVTAVLTVVVVVDVLVEEETITPTTTPTLKDSPSKEDSLTNQCQICKKTGHEASDCWYRYEENYQPKVAGAATTSYGVDTNWYVDSGATDHITSELEKLTVRDRYNGQDQVHTASGSGGLYPLVPQQSSLSSSRQVFGVNKPSTSRWHSRLGHPAIPVVKHVLRKFNLPVSSDLSHELVCDPCQQAKSHQLPYPKSTSMSKFSLELVYSDVWGPAPMSVGRHTYYVSFIDDYSKFTWIYLLKRKSDVFQAFHNFRNHVERKFNRKILTMQSDWGGEYERLNSFFQRIGIAHHVSCPHAHQQNGSAERKH
ncbi:hypothetical protein U9M48_040051 [Paspalum notatum var. saurae]|uniref:Integrase catalytic domain-containing protein n=1 Tax=Paspalum notatum var. saurae TaxID=547442 RepID=A0AAQ3UPN7_PASNO